MRQVLDLVDVGDGCEIRVGNALLDELLDVPVERWPAGHVVVDALMVDGRVEVEAHKRGAAFLARCLHEAGRAQHLGEVDEPLEGLGHMCAG